VLAAVEAAPPAAVGFRPALTAAAVRRSKKLRPGRRDGLVAVEQRDARSVHDPFADLDAHNIFEGPPGVRFIPKCNSRYIAELILLYRVKFRSLRRMAPIAKQRVIHRGSCGEALLRHHLTPCPAPRHE
jgi:hypothetical protein